jgi:hypothetical protein
MNTATEASPIRAVAPTRRGATPRESRGGRQITLNNREFATGESDLYVGLIHIAIAAMLGSADGYRVGCQCDAVPDEREGDRTCRR